jgi:hypothetical protein
VIHQTMTPRHSLPRAVTCLRNSLLVGLLVQGAALAGPQEDARRYAQICLRVPTVYRMGCLRAAVSRLQADWGQRQRPAPSSRGSVTGRNTHTVIDSSGGCEGGSCFNSINRW